MKMFSPKFGTEDWDIVRREGLENFVKELYSRTCCFHEVEQRTKKGFLRTSEFGYG